MSEQAIPDASIPKALRDVIRARRRAAIELHTELRCADALSPRAFKLIDTVAELTQSLRKREWLARVTGFDPIALGM